MGPAASSDERTDTGRAQTGIAWASVIAILFAAIAAISFAVDQSVTLSNLAPAPPANSANR